jgi:beta-D-xylosidase 4
MVSPPTSTYNISSIFSVSSQANTTKFPDQSSFVTLPVTIQNIGATSSPYVLLAFLSGSFGPEPYPLKSLVGYQRVTNIEPGKSEQVGIQITVGNLAVSDERGNMVLWPGQYKVTLDVDGTAGWNFTLVGEKTVLDAWPAAPAARNSTS